MEYPVCNEGGNQKLNKRNEIIYLYNRNHRQLFRSSG